jgi:hypothetical protein
MSNTQNQIDYDGPQHIDGAAAVPGTGQDISKAMPPQDVMDAAMLLTEACSAWSPAAPPNFNINALPAELPAHNQSYVLHQDLCSLATDPVGFNEEISDAFGYGMFVAVVLACLFWILLLLKAITWVVGLFSWKKRSAEAAKARLIVEAAKLKVDEINRRQAPGAAE